MTFRIGLLIIAAALAFHQPGATTLANSPQSPEFQFPKDGNGVLDYCAVVIDLLDTHPTQYDNVRALKFGWCVGYLQATQERIVNWRMSAGIEIMTRGQSAAPPFVHADADFVDICLPDEASIAQLARVVVKWLREHPERLHELKSFLVVEALKTSFPCSARNEHVPPAQVKP